MSAGEEQIDGWCFSFKLEQIRVQTLLCVDEVALRMRSIQVQLIEAKSNDLLHAIARFKLLSIFSMCSEFRSSQLCSRFFTYLN